MFNGPPVARLRLSDARDQTFSFRSSRGGPGAPAPLFPSKWSRGLAPHAVTVPSKIAFAVAICVTCSLLRP